MYETIALAAVAAAAVALLSALAYFLTNAIKKFLQRPKQYFLIIISYSTDGCDAHYKGLLCLPSYIEHSRIRSLPLRNL